MTEGDSGSAAVGKSAMNKVLWRIVPLIALAYLCAYMDRVNVSFAATQMNADLGFSATIYGFGGGLFFLGYALFEIPSNLLLVRFGARKWIARIMITWGLLSAGMMFVQTPMQFYVVRFLLGVAEAGFYPGVIYYFASWFPPCHRSRAVSRFFIASPLASVVMGAISAWLLGLDGHGGLEGWQWLFLVQGLPTVLVGLLVFLFLPDTPDSVDWLDPQERDWIRAELTREQDRIGEPAARHLLASLRNPRVLVLGLIGFLLIGAQISIVLNAPMILMETARIDVDRAGYLISIGGLTGVAAILVLGNRADRNGDRLGISFWCSVVAVLGLLGVLAASSAPLVIGAYLAFATVCFAIPMLTSSAWADVLHVRELAVGAAAINTISQTGAFVMPFAWGAARDATGSFSAGIAGVALMMVLMAAVTLVLRRMVAGRPISLSVPAVP